MTTDNIIKALHAAGCHETARAFECAIEAEAEALYALHARGGKWQKRPAALEAAKEFYAEDIAAQLADPAQPSVNRMLNHRR